MRKIGNLVLVLLCAVMLSVVADELMKLKGLMESGVITAEEFEAQKKKILGE
ncbi:MULTISPECIES: SHOCT domain-containing protein [unclassified Butyrivibrio]|uniref:SHOCT domain-containing protein n=1 Tax=unclassified Butyrivibrio TaxID=2639466 RepID=UPI00040B082D|nr:MULTISPECIES: SHOCT domain-containing protein [unclassified Butyrivibrio]SEL84850.1 Short C-terminal domain-containing protein [Butyrivibrio sp. ob235]